MTAQCVFFLTLTYLSPGQQSLHHRQQYVNEIAVSDTKEAYSSTEDGTPCENSNVRDLLTIFLKIPIPDIDRHLILGPDFISGR